MREVESKIKTVHEIEAVAEALRAEGRSITLCHGVFDLLHVGHLRHLRVASGFGDALIVSITADEFVQKGPGRPVFQEMLRAEMLAALELVDYVVVVYDLSAEPILHAVKPDVYAKGGDYIDPDQDVTGKIVRERDIVEQHGGRLVFTEDITFSSSNLLNRFFNVFEPEVKAHLQELKSCDGERRIAELIEKIKPLSVLLVGDAIIDRYSYVTAMGKSAKEHMIATLLQNSETFAGGVFATANHVASFCQKVDLLTCLGGSTEDNFEDLIRASLRPNIQLMPLYRHGSPTTLKTRFVEPTYLRKLFEVYSMDDTPLATDEQREVDERLDACIRDYDVVIVNDFGHGLIADSTIDILTKKARFLAINAQINAGNNGFNLITKYARADYICLDVPEARMAVQDKASAVETVCGELLPSQIDCPNIIVTHGKQGCFAHKRGYNGVFHIPALTQQVVDTVGAGDAFLAVTAPMIAVGGEIDLVGFIGNIAGAVKVGIVGHRNFVEKSVMQKYAATLLK
jgi:rfaE bifunctional protein nucleotidyltransferase chain/domain